MRTRTIHDEFPDLQSVRDYMRTYNDSIVEAVRGHNITAKRLIDHFTLVIYVLQSPAPERIKAFALMLCVEAIEAYERSVGQRTAEAE